MKIKLAIDATNEVDVLSGITCLAGILKDLQKSSLSETSETVKPKEAERMVKAVKETPKPVDKPIFLATNAEMPKITLQDVRTELNKRVETHREAIKNKLNEFGAKSVSTLAEEHFEAMHEFLIAL